MNNVMYKTDRFYLRPLQRKDLNDRYQSWFHDQEITKYNSHGLFSYGNLQMEKIVNKLNSQNDLILAVISYIEANKSDVHIGNISLQNIDWINRSAEFACIFGEKDYWKQGYCTEATAILLHHGFNKLNLHRIWLGTAETNFGMIKVAKKVGMTKEGKLRDAMWLEGKYVDVLIFSKLT
jgi:RimJ/RimL family protein N-acetyltransferase